MKIEFLGSSGPMTVPRPLCHCAVCDEARAKGVPYSRCGPGIFIHGPNVLIDTSEDINFQINRANLREIRGVFYSHWHPDHVMGRRLLESLNANYVNHPPRNTKTDVFIPDRVAADFNRFLGTGEHLSFYVNKGWIRRCELRDGESVTIGDATVSPFRLAEEFAYGFLVEENKTKTLIIPDELAGWNPDERFRGLNLAILPIGVFEFHPLTGERMVDSHNPVLQEECTFTETIEIAKQLAAKRTVLTHINGLGFDDLMRIEQSLKRDGLNIDIAYDTLVVEVE